MFNRDTAIRQIDVTTAIGGRILQVFFVAGIMSSLMASPATAAENPSDSAYLPPTIPSLNVRELQSHDRNRLNFTTVNPFLHRLPSGLKFRGLRLYDNIYLSPQKQATDVSNALGISYADDGILYYFSPQLLSISFRY